MIKIKKGDTVKIMKGKDVGKSGKVSRVYKDTHKVIVDGLNVYKKHVKPKREGEKGQIVSLSRPMPTSNVMLVCPNCSKTSRIGIRMDGETKVRYCKKCDAPIIK